MVILTLLINHLACMNLLQREAHKSKEGVVQYKFKENFSLLVEKIQKIPKGRQLVY